jgi:tRNA pseudouridine55 synthase
VHSLELISPGEREIDLTVNASTGFYVRSLAHDIGVELGCGGYLHHLKRLAIGPYSIEKALPQEVLDRAEDPSEVIDSDAWIPLDDALLPFPDIKINAAATDRFVHGQEVVVFQSGAEPIETGTQVVVHAPTGALVGIGTVTAVLARGRTITIHPSMVLADGRAVGGRH